MPKSQRNRTKVIKVSLKNNDDTQVKVEFHGGAFTPEQFTSLFMAVLETYTLGLLETNTPEDIFKHFNNVFGIYLNKLVPEAKHYDLSKAHKEFKEDVDSILDKPLTEEDKRENEDNRFAAYLLTRDILIKDIGLTEESADVLLNKRLNFGTKLNNPGESNENSD